MATDSSVPITAGSGTNVETVLTAAGDHQQVIREARADGLTSGSWTITTAGSASVLVADVNRLIVLMTHNGTSRVWLRFDATIPTLAAHHWFLDPGDRYEVPNQLSRLPVSFAGQGPGGDIEYCLATRA